jgi:hypothetical protein
VSDWNDMPTHRLLYLWASTKKIQISVLDFIIFSLKINLFLPWYSWKIAEFALETSTLTIMPPMHFFSIKNKLCKRLFLFYNFTNLQIKLQTIVIFYNLYRFSVMIVTFILKSSIKVISSGDSFCISCIWNKTKSAVDLGFEPQKLYNWYLLLLR